mgnify:CR=1 FL=1
MYIHFTGLFKTFRERGDFMEIQELEDGTIIIKKEGPEISKKRIKVKNLKEWGLKLYYGSVDKTEQYFISTTSHDIGDKYIASGRSYIVSDVIDRELPKNAELSIIIDWEFGELAVKLMMTEDGKEYPIYTISVKDIVENIIKKRKLGAISKAEIRYGKTISIIRQNGECTHGIPLDEVESKFRRIFRSAKKLFKDDITSGEFIYRICGKDSFGYEVYYIEMKVSCYDIIDADAVSYTHLTLPTKA